MEIKEIHGSKGRNEENFSIYSHQAEPRVELGGLGAGWSCFGMGLVSKTFPIEVLRTEPQCPRNNVGNCI